MNNYIKILKTKNKVKIFINPFEEIEEYIYLGIKNIAIYSDTFIVSIDYFYQKKIDDTNNPTNPTYEIPVLIANRDIHFSFGEVKQINPKLLDTILNSVSAGAEYKLEEDKTFGLSINDWEIY